MGTLAFSFHVACVEIYRTIIAIVQDFLEEPGTRFLESPKRAGIPFFHVRISETIERRMYVCPIPNLFMFHLVRRPYTIVTWTWQQ